MQPNPISWFKYHLLMPFVGLFGIFILAFDGVAIGRLGSASRSIATSGSTGYGADSSNCATGGLAAGGWDEVPTATAGVGIGGSNDSLRLNLLSMIKEKYISSSMLASSVRILSYLRSCWPCFSLMARSSALKNEDTAEELVLG